MIAHELAMEGVSPEQRDASRLEHMTDRVGLVTVLEECPGHRTAADDVVFVVVTTHLYWNPCASLVQIQQLSELETEVARVTRRVAEERARAGRATSAVLVLCGDLNAEPNVCPCALLPNGFSVY